MISFCNHKNTHDFLHQFHWLKSNQKTKLIQSNINSNFNSLNKNPNLLTPFILYHYFILNQKPYVSISQKSIAAFNVRINNPIACKTHLHKFNLNLFYSIFITSILPSYYYKTNFKYDKYLSYYKISISYGFNNIQNPIIDLKSLNGAHIQWNFISPVKFLPFFYLKFQ